MYVCARIPWEEGKLGNWSWGGWAIWLVWIFFLGGRQGEGERRLPWAKTFVNISPLVSGFLSCYVVYEGGYLGRSDLLRGKSEGRVRGGGLLWDFGWVGIFCIEWSDFHVLKGQISLVNFEGFMMNYFTEGGEGEVSGLYFILAREILYEEKTPFEVLSSLSCDELKWKYACYQTNQKSPLENNSPVE